MKLLNKIKLNDNTKKISKTDWIIMGILVLIYGIISFIRLGDTKAPSTYKTFVNEDDYAIITLQEKSYISKIRYYVGDGLGDLKVFTSIDGEEYEEVTSINIGGVFYWADLNINKSAKFIKFGSATPSVCLGDVMLYDIQQNKIPVIINVNNPLTDELDLVPDEISFMNSTYFDEIYYGRTAYEYAHGIDVYEWTHPPLGKLIMTIPVALFGFSPFSYRLMGNIFGILLIPLMYILAKKFFKSSKWALLGGLIMMFDTFHFAHTRIALVDGFQVFFILLSVLFMKEYLDLGKKDVFKKKAKYLLLSGTFIGCAMATKWNAAYVAIALAIVFFIHLFRQYNVNVIKFCKSKLTINNISKFICFFIMIPLALYYFSFLIINKNVAHIILIVYYVLLALVLLVMLYALIFKDKELTKTIGVCILGFFIIPAIIYVLCYVLFPTVSYYDGTLSGILDINKMMYDYHAGLDATHPFSSVWYEWPIMANPVWLYSGGTSTGQVMTISDIGNPAIWWTGILAFVYLIIDTIKKRNIDYIYLAIFILVTFVPYVFIGRLMFMYHFFITLPFVMLAIVAFIKWLTEKTKNDKIYYGYIALIIIMFMIFYPVVSAVPISREYVDSLRWLPRWFF